MNDTTTDRHYFLNGLSLFFLFRGIVRLVSRCSRCNGSGRTAHKHVHGGLCFRCAGEGVTADPGADAAVAFAVDLDDGRDDWWALEVSAGVAAVEMDRIAGRTL